MEVQLADVAQLSAAAATIRKSLEFDAEVVEAPAEVAIRFRCAKTEIQLSELLAQLIQQGVRITQYREVQTDLEEAFMSFARPHDPVSLAKGGS